MKQNQNRAIFHWLLFLLISGFVTAALLDKIEVDLSTSIGRTETSPDLPALTGQLLAAAQRRNPGLTDLAQKRRQVILDALDDDPEGVFLAMMPDQVRRSLPQPVQQFLERPIDVQGELIVYHIDYDDGRASRNIYELADINGRRYKLHFADQAFQLLTGSKVRVKGFVMDSEIVLAAAGGDIGLQVLAAASELPTIGDQRTLAILLNFADNTSQPFTKETIYAEMFTNPISTNLYAREVSYNQTSYSGDVVGWYTINYTSANGECDTLAWVTAAESQATAQGIDVAGYPRRMYIFPQIPGCGFAGMATVGGNPSRSYYRGNHDSYRPNGNVMLFTHELGHNLGMHHASAIDCGAKAIDVYDNCNVGEYGDAFDPMGWWNLFHYSSAHKVQLKWLTSPQVQTVTAGGNYVILPLENSGANIKALRISKPDTAPDEYYISYRQPVGFDDGINSGISGGASIHIWQSTQPIDIRLLNPRTRFIDTTPATESFDDAALADGTIFNDAINGISITQLGHDANSATVSVTFGPGTCGQYDPWVTVSGSQSGKKGETKIYTITVTNKDSLACPNTTFALTSSPPAGWTASLSQNSISLSPGTSGTVTLSLTSASDALDGYYYATIQVADIANPNHSATATAIYYVYTPAGDSTAPSVRISQPLDGATVKGQVTVYAYASDNVGVTKLELYIDGKLVRQTSSSSISYRWNSNKATKGSHTIQAKAYDAAGNVGSHTIVVTK